MQIIISKSNLIDNKSPSLYLSFFKMEISVIKQHLNWNFKNTQKTNKDFNWQKELEKLTSKEGEQQKKRRRRKQKKKHNKDAWLEVIYAQMEVPKLIFRYAMKNVEGKLKYLIIKKFLLMIPTKKDLEEEDLFKDKYDAETLNEKYDEIIARFGQLTEYLFEYLEKNIIMMLLLYNIG